MRRIPINTDPYYPDAYHRDDHTPECVCENGEYCIVHDDYCDGCRRPAQLCNCP